MQISEEKKHTQLVSRLYPDLKDGVLRSGLINFNTAIGRGNMEVINYFLDNGFDMKADENSHLKAAIINEDEEIQQFLIDNGCTTKNLPTVHEGDCSWVRSYENSKDIQEKLSENLEEKESGKQTKI